MIDSFLDPAGPVASAQRAHLAVVVLMTMIAVLPVVVLVPAILWRYRYSNSRARYTPGWGRSGKLELVLWGVPFLIVAVLSVLLWRSTAKLDPYKPVGPAADTLRVDVIGLDWKWLFFYPDLGIATVNELAFPAGHPVSLRLTTDTVMQSFMVPALAGQIYAMPGMVTRLNFEADRPGTFRGMNTQYSGTGFHAQTFRAVAMKEDDFRAWGAGVAGSKSVLSRAAYARLAKSSTAAQAQASFAMTDLPAGTLRFRLEDAGLFDSVLDRYRSGGKVDAARQPGSHSYNPAMQGAGR